MPAWPYTSSPPYLGDPKFANDTEKPLRCLAAAVAGSLIFRPPCSITKRALAGLSANRVTATGKIWDRESISLYAKQQHPATRVSTRCCSSSKVVTRLRSGTRKPCNNCSGDEGASPTSPSFSNLPRGAKAGEAGKFQCMRVPRQ